MRQYWNIQIRTIGTRQNPQGSWDSRTYVSEDDAITARDKFVAEGKVVDGPHRITREEFLAMCGQ